MNISLFIEKINDAKYDKDITARTNLENKAFEYHPRESDLLALSSLYSTAIPKDYCDYIINFGDIEICSADFIGINCDLSNTKNKELNIISEIINLRTDFDFPDNLIPLNDSFFQGDAFFCIELNANNPNNYKIAVWWMDSLCGIDYECEGVDMSSLFNLFYWFLSQHYDDIKN